MGSGLRTTTKGRPGWWALDRDDPPETYGTDATADRWDMGLHIAVTVAAAAAVALVLVGWSSSSLHLHQPGASRAEGCPHRFSFVSCGYY